MRWLVGTSAFARGEVVSTLRQPRLLLTLVLGPFLVLFVFGIGYRSELPQLSTLVVAGDPDLTDRVDQYVRDVEVEGIRYVGLAEDRDAATDRLVDNEVDLVIELPQLTMEEVAAAEDPTVINVFHQALDPVTAVQIGVAAETAISQINDEVIKDVLADTQSRSGGLRSDIDRSQRDIDEVRTSLGDDDVQRAEERAGPLADRLDALADGMEGGTGMLGAGELGGEDPAQVQEDLRTAADGLEALDGSDAVERLDRAEVALDQLDEATAMLDEVDPTVAVTPFEPMVYSQTPIRITLDRFYAPGLLALMLQHIAVTFGALSIVRERALGTTELLRVAPVSTGQRLVGKATAYLLLGGLTAAGLTVLIHVGFDVPWPGGIVDGEPVGWLQAGWGRHVAIVGLTLLASLGYGFLVAAVARTDTQAVQLSMLVLLAGIFYSGMFLPLSRIGMPALAVSWGLPATWGFLGFQDLMLTGDPVQPMVYLVLAAMALVLLGLATFALSRRNRA